MKAKDECGRIMDEMNEKDKPTKKDIALQVVVAVIGIALGASAAWVWLWK